MGWLDFEWLWRWILRVGLYQKHGKMLFLGLDNAGKTTLMHLLADDRLAAHPPTQRATREEIKIEGVHFECFDLGGHAEAREIWGDYYVDASAIVFLVDAADRRRLDEARAELNSLLTNASLKDVPVLVLGNKIDLAAAASEPDLRRALALVHTTGRGTTRKELGGTIRPIELFMCSVANRSGFAEGIRWVAQFIE